MMCTVPTVTTSRTFVLEITGAKIELKKNENKKKNLDVFSL